MTVAGDFNTDTRALEKRIQAHDQFGSKDINEWIFDNLELSIGISIVDLGCGTGKQTIPLAQFVGDDGHILAVDISQEALDTLSKESEKKGLSKRIKLLCCGLDDLKMYLTENTYDRIVSSFSLYYSHHTKEVFESIRKALKVGSILFFCGPSKDNNIELRTFHNRVKGSSSSTLSGGALFMEEVGPSLTNEVFGKMEIVHFSNTLKFNSAESLCSYWSSYNLYDKNLKDKFLSEAIKHFKTQQVFETQKRVIGIKARK
ncbi:MAG: class I SAM-dependent methyltransferase [Ignavibacteriales bacterium]|nr:MAG: class I SAM-dependent methyltransferase [Ignavibacteriales bacterium]